MKWLRSIDRQTLMIVGVVAFGGLLMNVEIYRQWPRILEGSLYVGVALLLAAHPKLRRMIGQLPKTQRTFLFVLVGAMVFAQMWSQPRRTFPIMPWTMYTGRIPNPPRYFEYVGICDDGREIVIPTDRVFRSQGRTASWRLHARWRLMHSVEDQRQREVLRERYVDLLNAIVLRFNARHPDTQVERVRLIQCDMPRPFPGRKLVVTRTSLGEINLR